jgi:catechol 2,3-dioxygenase-like lactoylglutathione lyase family enzyme
MKINLLAISFTFVLSHFFSQAISQTPLTPRFNHVFLYVSNLDSSLQFYEAAFDVKVVNRFTELEITQGDSTFKRNLKIVFLKFSNQDFVLELAERPNTMTIANQPGVLQHVGIEVEDIGIAFKRLSNAGGKIMVPIRKVRTNSGLEIKQAFFTGPDEEQLELVQVISGGY